MKFNVAWAKVAAQNVSLKIATVILAVFAAFQLIVIGQLALRTPLVIERACFSKALGIKNADPTAEEIKAFLVEALPRRFDTNGNALDGYISPSESSAREKEQAALKTRQIIQRVLVSEVKIDGKNISVMADRLLSIGKIRTLMPLNLTVTVEVTSRSEANPYGLILASSNQIEEKEDKR
jgi:hypothetical protein